MRQAGFDGTRIVHRLEIALGIDENRSTGPIRFVDGETVVHEQADDGPQEPTQGRDEGPRRGTRRLRRTGLRGCHPDLPPPG